MTVIIDRFEGELAVVELPEGGFVSIPALLVPDAKEGDAVRIEIDAEYTAKREQDIDDLFKKLFKD